MMTAPSGQTQPTRMLVCQGWPTLSFCNRHTRKHASCQGITDRGIEETQPNKPTTLKGIIMTSKTLDTPKLSAGFDINAQADARPRTLARGHRRQHHLRRRRPGLTQPAATGLLNPGPGVTRSVSADPSTTRGKEAWWSRLMSSSASRGM